MTDTDKLKRRITNKSNSICWSCQNAYANKCPRFVLKKRPLKIWKKFKIIYLKMGQGTNVTPVESYVILKCDKYLQDKPKPSKEV